MYNCGGDDKMTAAQVQTQLLEEIETLTPAQRLVLLEFIRSFRPAFPEGTKNLPASGPLKLHLSAAGPVGSFRRDEIYGDDGR